MVEAQNHGAINREEKEKVKGYYGVCVIGGMLSSGTTHLVLTPLDVLKVNMQVHPVKYNSIASCYATLLKEHGPSAFWRGWAGKFFGYGVQAIKVQVQAQPHFAKGLVDGIPKLYASEGIFGFYRGLLPLWGRNLPFSMVMFSTFEHSVDFLYRNVIRRAKEDCSKAQQLGVTCLAGYAAGSVGSFISNPADNIVASLYNKKADSFMLAVKKIGIINLFTRSLPIRIMLVGPVVTLQWCFYDTIKVLSGLPTSGEVTPEVEVDGVA
ncbi:Mitochondrial phosphate carrier protein like [Melia azedarach]|uniref:Mitochondrial phosphate carrier protein like n=1 Tax=Melia azedarach TaxID=155640 RepID=A0ACC1XRA8_MELAZ|nr:Mitochondrial phosphate carrier protein like [Melia azedarach]